MKSNKKKSTATRGFYVLIAAIAIVAIGALTYAASRPRGVTTASPIDSTLPPVKSNGYVMGSPNAPLEVVEFGDFECPQCGRFATITEPDVRERLVKPGIIRFRFIDFPLDMHRNTWNASRAAACADEQGLFWQMHDAIFAAQDQWDTEATDDPDKVLKQIGEQIVPNKKAFDQCVDTKATQAKIQAHWKLAMARQLQGTPTFIIGSKQTEGAVPYDDFKALVDSAVAQLPAAKKVVPVDSEKAGVALPVKKGK